MYRADDYEQPSILLTVCYATLRFLRDRLMEAAGLTLIVTSIAMTLALSTYNPLDPSFNNATADDPWNLLGIPGAYFADVIMQTIGLGSMAMVPPIAVWGWWLMAKHGPGGIWTRIGSWLGAIIFMSTLAASLPLSAPEPLQIGLGGVIGDWAANTIAQGAAFLGIQEPTLLRLVTGSVASIGLLLTFGLAIGMRFTEFRWQLDGERRDRQDRDPLWDQVKDWATGAPVADKAMSAWSHIRTGAIAMMPDRLPDWVGGRAPESRPQPVGMGGERVWYTENDPAFAKAFAPGSSVRQAAGQTDGDEPANLPAVVDPPFADEDEPIVTDAEPIDDRPAEDGPIVAVREDRDPNWDSAEDWDEDAPPPASAALKRRQKFSLKSLLAAGPFRILTDRRSGADDADVPPPPPMPGSPGWTDDASSAPAKAERVKKKKAAKPGKREKREAQTILDLDPGAYRLPPLNLLQKPQKEQNAEANLEEVLEQNARLLETVLQDFGIKGEIINVHPGPVVTLYELEPAPGIKSSRVIGLADDIARSMSAVSARVAVIPGRNAIGIELPNKRREMVLLRELLASEPYEKAHAKLALALGKDIGGAPVIADLSAMPHLLIAGTTGSGKSVAINTMILSLLYRLPPYQCKLILIDPKMLELSVYEGIPHLLTPVVTDPKKAVVALKWVVREMEDRYRKMSKLGVRNIRGYNERMKDAMERRETLTRSVQTGFDKATGEPIYEEEVLPLENMPFIVVVVDEMADLMMVAGKDIEAAVQRLAQMARAAGIHLITATQRPSVDVITGTIKANFPTRISFQVTSKIDSRTILGEQGAEQLLGQGDMLYMAGGGRIRRVHGPFVSDAEVEDVVKALKKQGKPAYVEDITVDPDPENGSGFLDLLGGEDGSGDELYDKAVAIVARDKKASTSYIQRKLQIGYNRAARLIERMEEEGVVSPANHVGKREILVLDHSGMED